MSYMITNSAYRCKISLILIHKPWMARSTKMLSGATTISIKDSMVMPLLRSSLARVAAMTLESKLFSVRKAPINNRLLCVRVVNKAQSSPNISESTHKIMPVSSLTIASLKICPGTS